VLAANATMLVGEWRNRRGEPDAVVVLTERELPLGWRARDDSGLSLRLESSSEYVAEWFDEARLREVGFDCTPPLDARSIELHYDRLLPREGFVVLEMEGASWERWREAREQEIRDLERRVEIGEDPRSEIERIRDTIAFRSRLFAVDAGVDAGELRRRHPDRARFLILPAVLDLNVIPASDPEADEPHPPRLEGAVTEVRTSSIHVPLAHRPVLDAVRGTEPERGAPRYAVTLAVGSRHRPWIATVASL
jgi:hypothetical protein